jgi:hypothetical protein
MTDQEAKYFFTTRSVFFFRLIIHLIPLNCLGLPNVPVSKTTNVNDWVCYLLK